MFFYKFLLKWGKMKKILSPTCTLKLKNIILFLNWGLIFFKWSYSQRCENRRWKWQRCFDVVLRCLIQRWKTPRCFNVVLRCKIQRWRTQRCFNVDLTLWGVVTSYQPKNNIEPTLKCLLGGDFFKCTTSFTISKEKTNRILALLNYLNI